MIEDLDDYHMVIKADDEFRVRRELEAEVRPPYLFFALGSRLIFVLQLEKNTYSLE